VVMQREWFAFWHPVRNTSEASTCDCFEEWGLRMVCTAHPTCHWVKAAHGRGLGTHAPRTPRLVVFLRPVFSPSGSVSSVPLW
jgi:hypothetical protein